MNDPTLENRSIVYIDSDAELAEFSARLSHTSWFALDTEFIREKTYFPQLCLIQITLGSEAQPFPAACIDPLQVQNLQPLLDIVFDDTIIKVMHAGRQDLEIFYHLCGRVPQNVFDTQLAAPYLGYTEQMSYAALVTAMTGVELNKSMTRTDWRARPLSSEQVQYAANDVTYLAHVYEIMRARLEEKNRMAWVTEEFAKLIDKDNFEQDPQTAWQRIRGYDRLNPASLATLVELAAWREQKARTLDYPRNWVLRDEQLLEIARIRPKNKPWLRKIHAIPEKANQQYADEILLHVAASLEKPPPSLGQKKYQKLSTEQSAIVDILMSLVRQAGVENDINPIVIASRKDVEQFLLKIPSKLDDGWRYELIGADLAAMLNGKIAVKIYQDHVKLIKNP